MAGYFVVPSFFAAGAFFYVWRKSIRENRSVLSAALSASVSAFVTFGFFLMLLLVEYPMTPA